MAPSFEIPPFPDNIPTVELAIIDFERLMKGDENECRRVLESCQGTGFFLLKNHHVDSEFMFDLADSTFRLPLDEKMKYAMNPENGLYFGYKHAGAHFVDDKGTPDSFETYHISKDDIVGVDSSAKPLSYPTTINDRRAEVEQFIRSCHGISVSICRVLSIALGLDPEALPSRHTINGTGGDHARITHAPPVPADKVCFGEHSDFGSVTILFNRLGGLQVLLPGTRKFAYVKPQPGLACINLGDAMAKFSGGRICSGVHRVVAPPGEQANLPRHSVVYFSRPNGNAKLGDLRLSDEEIAQQPTADEWIARRVKATSVGHYKGAESFEISKGTEHYRKFVGAGAPQSVAA